MKTKVGFVIPNWPEIEKMIYNYVPKTIEPVVIFESIEKATTSLKELEAFVIFSGSLDKSSIEQMEKLKFVQLLTAGYDTVDVQALKERNIPVADNNGINANSVAEHAIMFMLTMLRSFKYLNESIHSGNWQGPKPCIADLHEIQNKTIGIVGLGRIGTLVAEKLQAFKVKLQYYDIQQFPEKEAKYLVKPASFEELLQTSDIITVHVPLTYKTEKMFYKETFSKMKKGSYFINTSRGGVVEIADLVEVLKSNHLAGAALDVFETEPITLEDAKNWNDIHLLVTPHRAGSSLENWQGRIQFAFRNLETFLDGHDPVSLLR